MSENVVKVASLVGNLPGLNFKFSLHRLTGVFNKTQYTFLCKTDLLISVSIIVKHENKHCT